MQIILWGLSQKSSSESSNGQILRLILDWKSDSCRQQRLWPDCADTLTRLREWVGWSESTLGEHVIWYEMLATTINMTRIIPSIVQLKFANWTIPDSQSHITHSGDDSGLGHCNIKELLTYLSKVAAFRVIKTL